MNAKSVISAVFYQYGINRPEVIDVLADRLKDAGLLSGVDDRHMQQFDDLLAKARRVIE